MGVHLDLSGLPLAVVAAAYFFGPLSFEATIVLLLVLGLPYTGPPN